MGLQVQGKHVQHRMGLQVQGKHVQYRMGLQVQGKHVQYQGTTIIKTSTSPAYQIEGMVKKQENTEQISTVSSIA